jgi:hypothetical protein
MALTRSLNGLVLARLALLWVVIAALAVPCWAGDIDSLACRAEAGDIVLSFRLDDSLLLRGGIPEALDGNLRVECVVSIAVIQRGGLFGSRTVVADRLKRTLTYSRTYREFVVADAGVETYFGESLYEALGRFGRFQDLVLFNTANLERHETYHVRLGVEVRLALPHTDTAEARFADTMRALADILRSDEPLFTLERRSRDFTPAEMPERLFREAWLQPLDQPRPAFAGLADASASTAIDGDQEPNERPRAKARS